MRVTIERASNKKFYLIYEEGDNHPILSDDYEAYRFKSYRDAERFCRQENYEVLNKEEI